MTVWPRSKLIIVPVASTQASTFSPLSMTNNDEFISLSILEIIKYLRKEYICFNDTHLAALF